jgi:hypothetical protein
MFVTVILPKLTHIHHRGWVQSSIAGANLQWPAEFGLNVDINNPYTHDVWVFGAVNAITYFSASAV